ncbi:transposase, partial [Streptomyces sp. SID12488]|uniref:transposase n=1 Tax=Streptomyces sp. SID12488 TaxID=2706040 RepID=UPI001EF284E7
RHSHDHRDRACTASAPARTGTSDATPNQPGDPDEPQSRNAPWLEAHPLSPVLTSMPGVGVRTAAVLLVTVGDGTGFPTAGHLASYAGLAPATRSSGTSIHGEHAPRGGNRQLKRAMFLSAFACMNADAASRAYYDRQRTRGKTHTQALLRLARQRISVLFAMLRDGTFYEPRTPETVPA